MRQPTATSTAKQLVEYDALQRRLWILGQRCHHGATGAIVAAAGCLDLLADRDGRAQALAVAATGGLLMVHDWKDHSIWFERGRGSQPPKLLPGPLAYARRPA